MHDCPICGSWTDGSAHECVRKPPEHRRENKTETAKATIIRECLGLIEAGLPVPDAVKVAVTLAWSGGHAVGWDGGMTIGSLRKL